MKFFAPIVAALAFLAVPIAAKDYSRMCSQKAPEVVAAIGRFCTKMGDKAFYPNPAAEHGYISKYEGKKVRITIQADCKPKQWIPKTYCMQQLYKVCASGQEKDKGSGVHQWGRNKCQKWYIDRP